MKDTRQSTYNMQPSKALKKLIASRWPIQLADMVGPLYTGEGTLQR